MDMLGLLPRTNRGHLFLLGITDRYKKLAEAISVKHTTASYGARVYSNHFVSLYSIPSFTLTKTRPQFTWKFFTAPCASLRSKLDFTTAYHPQTNGQTEQ